MSEKNRVVITGIGALSPIGNDAHTSWNNALKGVNGIDEITRINTDPYNVKLAGELKDFNIDAQYEINDDNAARIGVWIGSGIGGMETFEYAHNQLLEKGPRRVSPFFVPMLIPDMATG